jgi:hypothetical protein
MKSSSSGRGISLAIKVREWGEQLRILCTSRAPWRRRDFSGLERDFERYEVAARAYGGFELRGATAFEVGCGQRPYRLFYLTACGVDAHGVDLDKVVMGASLSDFFESLKINGAERATKTLVRALLFDGADNRQFHAFLTEQAGRPFNWPMDRIFHGSAAEPSAWPQAPTDFVYSEDVFEHIPPDELPAVCEQISCQLSSRGIAYIKPLVFTGIQGGHSVDWYTLTPNSNRRCPPWEHLLENRFPANTYLNRLTRSDFRKLFSRNFEILEESVVQPDLGREYMTPPLREALSAYSDEDLFSNGVVFVLRSRRKA